MEGFKAYKHYWEDQAGFVDKSPWDKDKILKLTFSNNFDDNLKELQCSHHSLKKKNGKYTLRVKVPYNYNELDDFKLKSLEFWGIQENWITDIALSQSHCSHHQ